MAHEDTKLLLSQSVISQVDLGRLRRELNSVDDFIVQSRVRKAGSQPAMPQTSHMLEELAKHNKLNLLIETDRKKLDTILKDLYSHAPILHISFASDPSPIFLRKIITWLRSEIHPHILLQTGLQPSIAAGCIIRTPNKYLDLSLRKRFEQKRDLLRTSLEAGGK